MRRYLEIIQRDLHWLKRWPLKVNGEKAADLKVVLSYLPAYKSNLFSLYLHSFAW